ncbi:MAG: rod shape-determining protein MreC [Parcubacteria group bacterium]
MKSASKIKVVAGVIVLIAVFVVLNLTGWAGPFREFFYSISAPIQKNLWRAGANVSDFFEAISEIKNLKAENEKLKLQNQELSAKVAKLSELKSENETLRNALQIGLEKDFRLILADVTSKEVDSDVILINKGQKDGMAPGMPVISEQRVLVGKILEVSDCFSKVLLITSKDSSFDIKISDTKINGLAKGAGNFKLILDLIPRESEIKETDEIITSVLGGIFPEGILVGKISKVEKNDIESFQKAQIQPSFDIKELNRVFIIANF